ncbi:lia operon protein LiaF [Tumebacillus sp. BK434]|uniref:cell wall-active antibiotics response protein LiaF n=1 Tax=Tumebacillus sp. BK434 TaxID=2512169 RepID=UPI0010D6CC69|nr:cell wall-active antibiotics response protein LiaF [Tumebacillus sp. BK434]TCP58007.1 lia operon protein LiaF [Tumebacillus sp. BK434]
MRLPQNPLFLVVAIVLIIIVLSALGLFLPFLLGAVGYWLYRNRSKKAGLVLMVIGGVLAVQQLSNANLIGIVIALGLIYVGYKLIKSQERKRPEDVVIDLKKAPVDEPSGEEQRRAQGRGRHGEPGSGFRSAAGGDFQWSKHSFSGSLVGTLRMLNHPFDLDGLNVSYGVCDVKIDLSKAILPEGETTIVIAALIGDIDIYVPYDLDVSVAASVSAGNLEVLGTKQGGLNCQMEKTSPGYSSASRKVKISISVLLGDVDVRCL